MQQQDVALPRLGKQRLRQLCRKQLVCTAQDDDGVLALGRELNDGVTRGSVQYADEVGVHTAVLQKLKQRFTVLTDGSRMQHRSARSCSGDGLVQPLAAAVYGQGGGGQRLARTDEARHRINVIKIERT